MDKLQTRVWTCLRRQSTTRARAGWAGWCWGEDSQGSSFFLLSMAGAVQEGASCQESLLWYSQMHPTRQVTGSIRAGPSYYTDLWLIGDNEETDLCSHTVRPPQSPMQDMVFGALQCILYLNFPFQSAPPPVQGLAEESGKIFMYFLKNVEKSPWSVFSKIKLQGVFAGQQLSARMEFISSTLPCKSQVSSLR